MEGRQRFPGGESGVGRVWKGAPRPVDFFSEGLELGECLLILRGVVFIYFSGLGWGSV